MVVPQADPAPETPPAQSKRSGGILIIWGALLIVLAIAVGVGGVVGGINEIGRTSDQLNALARTDCPGSRIVTINAGKQDVYAELPGSDDRVPDADVEISNARTGRKLEIVRSNDDISYDLGDTYGQLIGTVNIPTTDQYLIEASGDQADQVAVGNFSDVGVVVSVVAIGGGVVTGLMAGSIGLVLLILGLSLRIRSGRAAA